MDDDPVRQQKIIGILNQEIADGEDLAAQARNMIAFLLLEKKGYSREELQKQVVFEVRLDSELCHSSVDYLVTVEGRKAMVIKCAAGSLSSRERQAIAAARLLASPPVPIAVVADPVTAVVLDAASGKELGEGFGAIPLRDEIVTLLAERDPKPLSPERLEKEKRILLAFDAIRCSVPQGADGGVQIGPEPGKDDACK